MAFSQLFLPPRVFSRLMVFLGALALCAVGVGYVFSHLLFPVLASLGLAYLISPMVHLVDRVMPRGIAIAVFLLISLSGTVLAGVFGLPALYTEIVDLLQYTPKALESLVQVWIPALEKELLVRHIITHEHFSEVLSQLLSADQVSDSLKAAFSALLGSFPHLITLLVNFLLIPIITFFLVLRGNKMQRLFFSCVPKDLRHPLALFLLQLHVAVFAVIKGQIIVAMSLGVLYMIGFSTVGLSAGIFVGLCCGVARIIPYFDIFVGLTLAGISVFSADIVDPKIFFWSAAVIGIVQMLDGALITPRIIGDRVGLHPLLVVLGVMAFGGTFGFWGVLLAIPLLAVVKTLVGLLMPYYRRSSGFMGN